MKVGILGAGNIASTVSKTLIRTPGIECYAVGSRDEEKAKAFSEAQKIKKAYEPNLKNKKIYDKHFVVFKQLYKSNAKNFKLLNK